MTSSSISEHPVSESLYVGFGTGRPSVTDLTVFQELTTTLLDTEFTFAVIGSSHYVHAPAADFHEIISCKTISHDTVYEIDLREEVHKHCQFSSEMLTCETYIETRPIETFAAGDSFALHYEFAPDAITAIDLDEGSYETYHTYPEFDCVVYSETELRLTD